MPPHLHPRSRLTTSLFGTTLLVSFLVVGMPHIIPCPTPRVAYADSNEILEDGRTVRKRRRRRCRSDQQEEESDKAKMMDDDEERKELATKARECPVPKPGGIIGEVLGFGKREIRDATRPEVRVERRRGERIQGDDVEER